jgi:hypothetical protein
MPVDDNDICIGLGQQLICEAHAGGTAADDQIVGRQHCYPPGTYPPDTVLAAIWQPGFAIQTPARPRASPSRVLPAAGEH